MSAKSNGPRPVRRHGHVKRTIRTLLSPEQLHQAIARDPGVIHQNVNPAKFRRHAVEPLVHGGCIRDIQHARNDPPRAAHIRRLSRQRIELFLIPLTDRGDASLRVGLIDGNELGSEA